MDRRAIFFLGAAIIGFLLVPLSDGYAWVATRDPDPDVLAKGGDPGIIARFEIPIE